MFSAILDYHKWIEKRTRFVGAKLIVIGIHYSDEWIHIETLLEKGFEIIAVNSPEGQNTEVILRGKGVGDVSKRF